MRKIKLGMTNIEYPDEVGFCFNPVVINVYGFPWAYIEVTITDDVSNDEHKEKRAMFGSSCFFDLAPYAQGSFDLLDFNKVDYSSIEAKDSGVGRSFSVEVDMFDANSKLGDSFQFDTFIIWGTMKIGERYNGNRLLTWFKNFPFSVGMYSATSGSVNVTVDGIEHNSVSLPARKVWNLMLKDVDANREVRFELPGSISSASVFDNTFDFTFRGLLNVATSVLCAVDDSDNGVYIRWINRHGFYCYWLFSPGDEIRQVANDGEFIRNNMADYSYVNGYHGGTGRKQRKTESVTMPVCAPLVDSATYDFLFQIALSPVVDIYSGKDDEGVHRWQSVNVAVATWAKTKKSLQDFIATIILPETSMQSL